MKRIFIAFLILVLICAISIALFTVVTQSGIWAKELTLYSDIDKTKAISSIDSYLKMAVKADEPLNEKPAGLTESAYLDVKYFAGINMGYRIYFNPVTGESCIVKGLIGDKYYRLPVDYMYKTETNELYVITNLSKLRSSPVESYIYHEFRKNLQPVDSIPAKTENFNKYSINAQISTGSTVTYMLYADFLTDTYYVESKYGNFSVNRENITQLLSLDPVYSEYSEITHPVPELVVSAGYVLVPSLETVEWNRIKPNGKKEQIAYSNASTHTIRMPEPGTLITVTSKEVSTLPQDAVITLSEYHNGKLHHEYDMHQEEAYIPEFEGNLEYTLAATFEDGMITYDYDIKMELPAKVLAPYTNTRPGDVLAFFVNFSDDDAVFSLKTTLGSQEAVFFPYGDNLVALVPVNWWSSPGDYSVDVYRTQHQNTALYKEYDITILPDEFETIYQQLIVSDELAEKADPVNTANDYVMVRNAKSNSNETSYLDGTFILPLEGEFGTSYAQTRYINGENPYRHSGLDIDGDTGDPILAANSGVIVMVDELVRTGNTVIIDHGMNLFSSYLHMSAFDVELGDYVNKGDLIGKVGSTGFSTGPHLHWSITLDGNYMNPLWLVENPIVPY